MQRRAPRTRQRGCRGPDRARKSLIELDSIVAAGYFRGRRGVPMLGQILAPKFLVLYAIVAFGALRAPARPRAVPFHPPALQSLDAAGAVQRARLPVFGRARESIPGRRPVSRPRPALRAVDDAPRRGAEPLRRGSHPGRTRQQRRRLQFVLQARLEALLRQVVRRSAAPRRRRCARARWRSSPPFPRSRPRCSRSSSPTRT